MFNPSGLVGYWKFDEGTGTSSTDSSGNNNPGSLISSPTWTTGKVGGALSFNGSSNYITLASYPLSDMSVSNSGCAWILTSNISNSNEGGGARGAFDFSPNANSGIRLAQSSGYVYFVYQSGGTTYSQRTNNVVLSNNNWSYVCYVFNGSAITGYINGALAATVTASNNPYHTVRIIGASFTTAGRWLGNVDEVRIYNRALSAAEIYAFYNAGR